MKRFFTTILAAALVAVGGFAQNLKVGAAKVDITPDVSDLQRPIDSIRGRLYVRAIYISNGQNSAVIATIDGNASRLDEAISTSSASTATPVRNYIVSGTHTHSGSTGGRESKPDAATIQNALVKAADMAKASARVAKVGFAKERVDLNVNRDNYSKDGNWEQEPNWTAPSDKDLTVITFLGEDNVPIAVYMNYAMHPVNYFQSGVLSADFAGDACQTIETIYGDRTVALFSQGASGDQNPKLAYTSIFQEKDPTAVIDGVPPTFAPKVTITTENS